MDTGGQTQQRKGRGPVELFDFREDEGGSVGEFHTEA